MLAQTHDSGSNNNTLAQAMQTRLKKYSEDCNKVFCWNQEKHRVRCVCHKLALMVNAGLQALGLQAPPPALVKSTMLGDFPVSTTTLQSIAKEEEPVEGEDADADADSEDEVDDTELQPFEQSEYWYGVINGPHLEPDTTSSATNHNEANAVHALMSRVCDL